MQGILKNKSALALILFFILGMFIYNLFFAGSPLTATQSAEAAGGDLVKLSQELQNARLTTELFSTPSYVFLTDFTVNVPEQPIGRVNPFDIIGRD